MVKGISRRIVVIDAPDQRLFEQAIFIVRNDVAGEGVTAKALIQEARRVARESVGGHHRRLHSRISPQLAAALGAAAVGAAWAAAVLLA